MTPVDQSAGEPASPLSHQETGGPPCSGGRTDPLEPLIRTAIEARRRVRAITDARQRAFRRLGNVGLALWTLLVLLVGNVMGFGAGLVAGLWLTLVFTATAMLMAVFSLGQERAARGALRDAVRRLSGEEARVLVRCLTPRADTLEGGEAEAHELERREVLSVVLQALNRAPRELEPALPPPGGAGEVSPTSRPAAALGPGVLTAAGDPPPDQGR